MTDFENLDHLDTALAIKAAWQVRDVLKKMSDKSIPKGRQMNDLLAAALLRMSKAHHTYVSFVIFRDEINTFGFKSQSGKDLMNLQARIFALNELMKDNMTLYESGYFGQGSGDLLFDCFNKECLELRPQLIPLIEGENEEIIDNSYMSAIGNKYGDIYERQLDLSMGAKVNDTPKAPWWDTLIKPTMYRKYNQKQNAKL